MVQANTMVQAHFTVNTDTMSVLQLFACRVLLCQFSFSASHTIDDDQLMMFQILLSNFKRQLFETSTKCVQYIAVTHSFDGICFSCPYYILTIFINFPMFFKFEGSMVHGCEDTDCEMCLAFIAYYPKIDGDGTSFYTHPETFCDDDDATLPNCDTFN